MPEGLSAKWCGRCSQYLLAAKFGRNGGRPDGLAQYCRECFQQISRDSYRRGRAEAGVVVRDKREVADGYRWCPDCRDELPENEFARNASSSSGFSSYCKPHHNQRGRESKERMGGSRRYHLTRRYGISAAEVDDLIARQAGLCPICIRPLGARPHVDHDHVTGEVRGVLCFTCNGGLGNYSDEADRLRRAADYLDGTLTAPSRIAPGVYDVAGLGWRRTVAAEGRSTSD